MANAGSHKKKFTMTMGTDRVMLGVALLAVSRARFAIAGATWS